MRLTMERDKRTFDQLSNMIDWCQNDDFWMTNILSASALRRNYDKMKVRAISEWKQKKQGRNGGKKRIEKLPSWAKDSQRRDQSVQTDQGLRKASADQLAESKRLLESFKNKLKAGAKT